ncbi:MAG: 5-deoxy-glucuronate isomerase [Pyrinomonadaceae bacterium]|nr:5-deoxy-glucuronate isomerase [Pyrinomonadaceae bacterium]
MSEAVKLKEITPETCVVLGTDKKKGRNISVTPQNTASNFLHYGRIILDAGESLSFENETHETGLVCLKGTAAVSTHDQTFTLNQYDALYIPRDSKIEVTGECDLAEISAEVENQYPLQYISFAEVKKNGSLSFDTGGPTTSRNLNILFGKNVEAGRILAGVTFSKEGHWTSYPPHEHASMLEEAYLYIDMPAPNFGIQLVYTDLHKPELAQIVHEGDVVLMPKGYHPNVACPNGSINFLWMMAANREGIDRQFGVVNVQPEFAENGSGLEASRK